MLFLPPGCLKGLKFTVSFFHGAWNANGRSSQRFGPSISLFGPAKVGCLFLNPSSQTRQWRRFEVEGLVSATAFDGSPDIHLVTRGVVNLADLGTSEQPAGVWTKGKPSRCLAARGFGDFGFGFEAQVNGNPGRPPNRATNHQ